MHSVGVRDVHHERHEAVTELSLQTIGVCLLAAVLIESALALMMELLGDRLLLLQDLV